MMHGIFHVDGFVVFLLIGFIISMLLRIMTHTLIRWIQHVRYMKKLAGGTLIVDVEANLWLKLINDPDYVPQWRWTHGQRGVQDKRSLARKVGYVNMILVIIILAAVLMPHVIGLFNFTPGYVETETKMTVYGVGNLTFTGANDVTGWSLRVNGTEYGGRYPGGYVAAFIGIQRTDNAFATRDVILNLTSYLYFEADSWTPYVVNATWYIPDLVNPPLFDVTVIEGDGAETFFGIPIQLPQDVEMFFIVVIGLREFWATDSEYYAVLTATGSGDDSKIVFYGGLGRGYGID